MVKIKLDRNRRDLFSKIFNFPIADDSVYAYRWRINKSRVEALHDLYSKARDLCRQDDYDVAYHNGCETSSLTKGEWTFIYRYNTSPAYLHVKYKLRSTREIWKVIQMAEKETMMWIIDDLNASVRGVDLIDDLFL